MRAVTQEGLGPLPWGEQCHPKFTFTWNPERELMWKQGLCRCEAVKVRSPWIAVGSNATARVPVIGEDTQTHTEQGAGQGTTGAGTCSDPSTSGGHLGPPAARREMEQTFPQSLQREPALGLLEGGLLAS